MWIDKKIFMPSELGTNMMARAYLRRYHKQVRLSARQLLQLRRGSAREYSVLALWALAQVAHSCAVPVFHMASVHWDLSGMAHKSVGVVRGGHPP